MPRLILIGGLLYLLLMAGLGSLNAGMLSLALPLAAYLLLGFWSSPESSHLTAERHLSAERITPDGEVQVTLRVTNHGPAVESVLIKDTLPGFLEVSEGAASQLVSLKRGETLEWEYTLRGRRGFHVFSHLDVTISDQFGIFSQTHRLPTPGQLLVLPVVPRLWQVKIRPRVTRIYSGTIPARTGGAGLEYFGTREYQPGDSPRWINWRAMARHEHMIYSNEFEQERVADIGIILDGRRRVNEFPGGQSLFEYSVLAAASLSSTFLSTGNHVGLLIFSQYVKWVMPGYGKFQAEKIMQALARAEIGDSLALSGLEIPSRLLPPHSQLVVVSPLIPEDVENLVKIRRSGYPLIVISPDPISYEERISGGGLAVETAARTLRLRRALTIRQLRHIGIQVVDWDVTQPFEQVAQHGLGRVPAHLQSLGRGGRL